MSSKSAAAIKAKKSKQKAPDKKNNVVAVESLDEVKNVDTTETTEESEGTQNHYVYRDFSGLSDDGADADYEIDQEGLLKALEESTALAAAQTLQQQQPMAYLAPPPPIMRASGWVRSQRFPVKLYALLNQPQLSHVITWMPHGRSWKVLKPRIFETAVLPVFFESDNYHSFNRVINAWSFRRKSTGPDRGSYFHELFLRGKPHLQKFMRRLPRTHKKIPMSKDEEPDFYELEKTSPLPTLLEAAAELEQLKRQRQAVVASEVLASLS
mmetsp:Transcript_21423/g.32753  ORF Transcript_21423/g.32753 Transcript_21423/m.32753 type:complete len:268 (-) Transcript_21423:261-1064(-)